MQVIKKTEDYMKSTSHKNLKALETIDETSNMFSSLKQRTARKRVKNLKQPLEISEFVEKYISLKNFSSQNEPKVQSASKSTRGPTRNPSQINLEIIRP
jgi:hypothetical protein